MPADNSAVHPFKIGFSEEDLTGRRRRDAKPISIPFAISVFPGELYQAPHSWAQQAYPAT